MVSAVEQLAASLTFSTLAKSEELKKRIWFTLGALLVYRLGAYVPLPGIDPSAWDQIFRSPTGGILGMFNNGGGIHRISIFALGVVPYISAFILIHLTTMASPTLPKVRYLSVLLAALQAYGIAVGLEAVEIVTSPGWFFRISTVITLTGGTVFLTWLAEQVTSRGIGKGIPLILFAESVAELPSTIPEMFELGRQVALSVGLILVAEVGLIALMERAHRRLLVRSFEGQSSHLSLKLNAAGEYPPIFASSLLLLPTMVAIFIEPAGPTLFDQGRPLFLLLYGALIVFFAFFYTAIVFNPTEAADSLKKQGGFIPRISPGERTAEYIDYVLTRITVVGAAYLAVVCLIPEILKSHTTIPFYLGGTSLVVVVSVSLNAIEQIHGLLAHQHKGLIKSKLGGRRRRRGVVLARGVERAAIDRPAN